MRIVTFSDAHGKYMGNEINPLPKGDVLVLAGDCISCGTQIETISFLEWVASLPFEHKVFIPGNHDRYLENYPCPEDSVRICEESGIIMMIHGSFEIRGVKFFGSSYTPYFRNWAFNVLGEHRLEDLWRLIPIDTEVLVTHGPPFGILDRTREGVNSGSESLIDRIAELRNLRVHIFGHIHEAYGSVSKNNVRFYNVSVLDRMYQIKNPVTIIDV